ncbi:uncharacterized protein LOC111126843 [Crassostrea virginica]
MQLLVIIFLWSSLFMDLDGNKQTLGGKKYATSRNQNREFGTQTPDLRTKLEKSKGKYSTTTINPPSVLTETDIWTAVCNECKRVDSTLTKCGNICPGSDKISVSSILPLGDAFCYFCENYRYNANYYRMCRNRYCS